MNSDPQKARFRAALLKLHDEYGRTYEQIAEGMRRFGVVVGSDVLKNAKQGRAFGADAARVAAIEAVLNEYESKLEKIGSGQMRESEHDALARIDDYVHSLEKELREAVSSLRADIDNIKQMLVHNGD